MKQGMEKWLKRRGYQPVPVDDIHRVCNKFQADDHEACWSVLMAFEKGDIDEDGLVVAMCDLAGKTPEEVINIVKGNGAPGDSKVEEVRTEEQPGAV